MSRVDQLENRVEQLEQGQARLERGVVDERGRQWTLADFLGMGLSRRQALGAIAAIASGATLGTALTQNAVAQPTGDEGQVGTQANPVEVWASEIDASEIATGQVTLGTGTMHHDGELNSSGSGSHSYTLNSSYDLVVIKFEQVQNDSGGTQSLLLQVNGDTGSNYDFVRYDGGTTNGNTEWNIGASISDTDDVAGHVILTSAQASVIGIKNGLTGLPSGDLSPMAHVGENRNVTPPVDSFTVTTDSGNCSVKAQIYGWDSGIA